MSNIYVIAKDEKGPCKIGISANPKARLSSIQTGHPEPLVLWSVWPVGEPLETEAMAHAHFSDKRLKGEWFDITVKAAEHYLVEHRTTYRKKPGAKEYRVKKGVTLMVTAPGVTTVCGDAAFILAHKRKVKAEAQKRWRANRAKKAGKI